MKPNLRRITLYVVPAIGVAFGATTLQANTDMAPRSPAGPAAASSQRPGELTALDMRMTDLIGRTVADRDGNEIAEVKDVVIDTRQGTVAYAVLSDLQFMEDGDRMLELPVASIRGGIDGDRIVLDMDPSQLRSMRTFGEDQWPDWNDAQVGQQAAAPRYRRASQVLDASLKDREGRKVGEVEDLVVNLGSGRIRYGVAEFDTSWFKPGKLVVVPVRSVRAEGGDGEDVVLAVDRDAMRDAPSFDRSDWPNVNDGRFRRDIDTYVSAR